MEIIAKIGDTIPENCQACKCFVNGIGIPPYCCLGCRYTEEEIKAQSNGAEHMYYAGCLPNRPKSCILEVREEYKRMIDADELTKRILNMPENKNKDTIDGVCVGTAICLVIKDMLIESGQEQEVAK